MPTLRIEYVTLADIESRSTEARLVPRAIFIVKSAHLATVTVRFAGILFGSPNRA